MKAEGSQMKVVDLCRAFDVSRSGYYTWSQDQAGPRAESNRQLDGHIGDVYREHRGRYGSPRITRALQRQKIGCSENRVARRMKELGLAARKKKPFAPRTTDSRQGGAICSNLLLERLAPQQAQEVWLSDITYVSTGEGWLYLAGFLDACSRHHPHRSRQSVCQRCVSRTAGKNPGGAEHESKSKLL